MPTPPNILSTEHQDWEVILEIAEATAAPGSGHVRLPECEQDPPAIPWDDRKIAAADLIRNRRSAVAMDGTTAMARADFEFLLRRLLPAAGHPAFGLLANRPAVSLVLMVHRVTGLDSGLYVLVRDPAHLDPLREAMRETWDWQPPADCPADLPLYRLGPGDLRAAARQVSCGQDIAADGAFAVAMLANFDATLQRDGAVAYPELFRETGAIGQMLYLEAEAAGLSGTGIGCFFDDEVHRILGITDHSWQSLYHFTVGRALPDDRLRTAPPYGEPGAGNA